MSFKIFNKYLYLLRLKILSIFFYNFHLDIHYQSLVNPLNQNHNSLLIIDKIFINNFSIKYIMNKFKKNHSFTKRKEESTRIMEKYDNRCPVIVEKDPKSDLKGMDKSKFFMRLMI